MSLYYYPKTGSPTLKAAVGQTFKCSINHAFYLIGVKSTSYINHFLELLAGDTIVTSEATFGQYCSHNAIVESANVIQVLKDGGFDLESC